MPGMPRTMQFNMRLGKPDPSIYKVIKNELAARSQRAFNKKIDQIERPKRAEALGKQIDEIAKKRSRGYSQPTQKMQVLSAMQDATNRGFNPIGVERIGKQAIKPKPTPPPSTP